MNKKDFLKLLVGVPDDYQVKVQGAAHLVIEFFDGERAIELNGHFSDFCRCAECVGLVEARNHLLAYARPKPGKPPRGHS